MAPFEALYGRMCRTPLSWSQTRERKIFGPDLVIEAEEKVKIIQTNLKVAQCNTRFIKEHKPSNHICAKIKSHVYTTE